MNHSSAAYILHGCLLMLTSHSCWTRESQGPWWGLWTCTPWPSQAVHWHTSAEVHNLGTIDIFRWGRWRFPKIGVPLNHPFWMGIFLVNHPSIVVPPFMETPIFVNGREKLRKSWNIPLVIKRGHGKYQDSIEVYSWENHGAEWGRLFNGRILRGQTMTNPWGV